MLKFNNKNYSIKSTTDPFNEDDSSSDFSPEINAMVDMHTLKNMYGNEPWVYIACNAVAKKVASQPLRVYRELLSNGKLITKPIDNHSLTKKIYKPNDYESYTKFFQKVGIELSLMGNCIVWNMRFHKQLIILPTELVMIDFDSSGKLLRYIVSATHDPDFAGLLNANIVIMPEDIIHISLPNPKSMIWGLSPFIPARKSVLFDRYSKEYLLQYYLKQANPGPVLEMSELANERQAIRFLKSMEMKYTGRKNQRRTLILPKGVSAKNLSNTLAEQELKEHLEMNRQEIISILQIPPHEVGIQTTGSIGSEETDKQLKNFWESTIIPFQNLIADGLTLSYRKDLGETSSLKFDNSAVQALKDNEDKKADIAIKQLNFKTINEVRQDMYELKPIAGGDVIRGSNPFGGGGFGGGGFGGGSFQQPSGEKPTAGIIEPDSNIEESEEKIKIRGFLKENFDWWGKRKAQEDEAITDNEKDILKVTLELFLKQADFSVDLLKKTFKDETKEYKTKGKKERFAKELEKGLNGFEDIWVNESIPTLQSTMETGYDLSLNVPFNLPSQQEIEALRVENEDKRKAVLAARAIESFEGFNKTTTNSIMNRVISGLESSKTLDDIAKDIFKYFGEAAEGRAKTIARTEALIAVSLGQKAALDDAEEVMPGMKKTWLSAGDSRVRDSHDALDGKTVGAKEDFKSGLGYPRDPRSTADEIINCRCVMLMIPPEN